MLITRNRSDRLPSCPSRTATAPALPLLPGEVAVHAATLPRAATFLGLGRSLRLVPPLRELCAGLGGPIPFIGALVGPARFLGTHPPFEVALDLARSGILGRVARPIRHARRTETAARHSGHALGHAAARPVSHGAQAVNRQVACFAGLPDPVPIGVAEVRPSPA